MSDAFWNKKAVQWGVAIPVGLAFAFAAGYGYEGITNVKIVKEFVDREVEVVREVPKEFIPKGYDFIPEGYTVQPVPDKGYMETVYEFTSPYDLDKKIFEIKGNVTDGCTLTGQFGHWIKNTGETFPLVNALQDAMAAEPRRHIPGLNKNVAQHIGKLKLTCWVPGKDSKPAPQ